MIGQPVLEYVHETSDDRERKMVINVLEWDELAPLDSQLSSIQFWNGGQQEFFTVTREQLSPSWRVVADSIASSLLEEQYVSTDMQTALRDARDDFELHWSFGSPISKPL